ncbi:MAG: hypothetical protein Q8P66_00975 [Candidatus Colwellbacteria bacterium]|nr:hypothetical protein [Candidatus Colwellbacteria bacterium]
MNVRPNLIELLLDEKLNPETLQFDPWVKSLGKVMKKEFSGRELILHLREIFYRILVWRRAYLSEGHFGEKVSAAYEELEKAERKLVWEGFETAFVPLYREVAKKYGDIRSIDRDIVRLDKLLGPVNEKIRRDRCCCEAAHI